MFRLSALFFLLLGGLASLGQAQNFNELNRSRYSPAAYYNYAEPGDVTIQVNVWGSVRNPGLYEVRTGTQLRDLFSLSGGPNLITQPRRNRERRTIKVRLIRGDTIMLDQAMEDDIMAIEQNFDLQDGDVLTVELESRVLFEWRDVVSIVNTLGILALAASRIFVN